MKKVALAAILLVVVCFVYAAYNFYFGPYARGNKVAKQGRDLLRKIEEYRKENGQYPNQDWFHSLGEERYTVEDRIWIYFSPPLKIRKGELLFMTPLDYRPRYSFGIAAEGDSGGYILNWDARSLGFHDSSVTGGQSE